MAFINTDEVVLLKMRIRKDKGCDISLYERIRTGLLYGTNMAYEANSWFRT